MHAFVARLPQTAQSCSAAAARGRGSAGSADAAAEEEVADSDAEADADADADASGEGGGVGEEGTVNDGDVEEVDGPVAALDGFPPFFFVMVGGLWYRVSRRSAARASATTGPCSQSQRRRRSGTNGNDTRVLIRYGNGSIGYVRSPAIARPRSPLALWAVGNRTATASALC